MNCLLRRQKCMCMLKGCKCKKCHWAKEGMLEDNKDIIRSPRHSMQIESSRWEKCISIHNKSIVRCPLLTVQVREASRLRDRTSTACRRWSGLHILCLFKIFHVGVPRAARKSNKDAQCIQRRNVQVEDEYGKHNGEHLLHIRCATLHHEFAVFWKMSTI